MIMIGTPAIRNLIRGTRLRCTPLSKLGSGGHADTGSVLTGMLKKASLPGSGASEGQDSGKFLIKESCDGFRELLCLMVEGRSDLFITAGVPPSIKINGKIMPVTKTA